MNLESIAIATMTLARSRGEDRVLRKALVILQKIGAPVFVADGGSPETFRNFIKESGFSISPQASGLVRQVQSAIGTALAETEKPHILYTEPDKVPFFENRLEEFVGQATDAAMNIPMRDAESFATFPEGQRKAEQFMNEAVETITSHNGDFCYGPLLLNRKACRIACEAPEHLGWGWRFWLLGRLVQQKERIRAWKTELPCPIKQRRENSRQDQIYRLRQLRQNLEGLLLGLETAKI